MDGYVVYDQLNLVLFFQKILIDLDMMIKAIQLLVKYGDSESIDALTSTSAWISAIKNIHASKILGFVRN